MEKHTHKRIHVSIHDHSDEYASSTSSSDNQSVKVHVLNNEVKTFQSMPVSLDIESVNGQYSKEIKAKSCPHKVTGNYKVEDWSESKNNWPHLKGCDFPKPAREGLVDLLIGIDNVDLHYSYADVRGKSSKEPIARLGPLGWSCVGPAEDNTCQLQEPTSQYLSFVLVKKTFH